MHGPVTLIPVPGRLAVELSLPVITTEVCPYRGWKPKHLRARRKLKQLRQRGGLSLSDSRVTLIVCPIAELHSLHTQLFFPHIFFALNWAVTSSKNDFVSSHHFPNWPIKFKFHCLISGIRVLINIYTIILVLWLLCI